MLWFNAIDGLRRTARDLTAESRRSCEDPSRFARVLEEGRKLSRSSLLGISAFFLSLLAALSSLEAGVVINEVHYHPPSPDGKTLEFVELFNDGAEAVVLGGWSFRSGIEFVFPPDAEIAAGGFIVVARDREALSRVFGLPEEGVYGNFGGALDNDGDVCVLQDEYGAWVDSVAYDDRVPWPLEADGEGSSLQRLCSDSRGDSAASWTGAFAELPNPLVENVRVVCPVPTPPPATVVINEINYHPHQDRDEEEEYIELFNPGDTSVDLSGWTWEGITFEFPPSTLLEAGAYLVVCRNEAAIQQLFGIETTVGNFEGQLSNSGERLALLDAAGAVIDHVTYADQGDWPVAADAQGRSLEKILPEAPGDDPASWANSRLEPGEFTRVSIEGTLGNLLNQKVLIGINGPGEFIIDDIVLESLDAPGINIVPNGDFEEGVGEWRLRGNAEMSVVEEGIGVGGSAGLRILTADTCGASCTACSARNSVEYGWRPETRPAADDPYRLSFQYRYISGSPAFYCRVLNGVTFCLAESLSSPGEANTVLSETLPPFVTHRGRSSQKPTSADEVWVSTLVRSPSGTEVTRVEMQTLIDEVEASTELFDDGEHRDGLAGDGVYGGRVPAEEHDTVVLYRFIATAADGSSGISPLTVNDSRPERSDYWGYYVDDEQPESDLPVYHVIVPGVDPDNPRSINSFLNCTTLRPATFVYEGEVYPDVGLRFRGNTACILEKRNLKLKFNRGRWFQGVRKLNLQGIWTDKSLLREHLSWLFIRDMGVPYCETEFIRVHMNGGYHGLFLYLEHPDERFLDRNELNGQGCLYKARQPSGADQPIGVAPANQVSGYAAFWEEETCRTNDFTGVADFIDRLHMDSREGSSAQFFLDNTHPYDLIGYQLAQSVLNNIDSFAKNHFLYWDTDTDKWSMICWDMDLVFGKNFDPNVRPVGTLNDCMLSPGRDLNPWFTTTVLGNFRLHYLMDFFFRADEGYFQRAYLVRLWDILQEKYREDVYDEIFADFRALLDRDQADDIARWGRSPVNCAGGCGNCARGMSMDENIETLREQLRLHRRFLIQYIQRWHEEIPDHDRMKITEIMYNPAGASSDLEYVEILNTSDREIDLSGWQLQDAVTYTFSEGTMVPANGVVIVTPDRTAFTTQYPDVAARALVVGDYLGSLRNTGEKLRLVDAGPGFPATIDLVIWQDGGDWPDARPGHSIELVEPTADLDNDDAFNWAASLEPFGTPGSVGVDSDFVRGEVNQDGAVNLTDGVAILQYLFQGGAAPACEDAADVDDDGQVILTDAVYLLNFLFAQGVEPPAPFPEPGADEMEDELLCP